MTEMQLLMTDASRKGLVSPQVLKEALELLKPGGKSKFIQAVLCYDRLRARSHSQFES